MDWLLYLAVLILWALTVAYAYFTGCVNVSRAALKSLDENEHDPDWLERQKRVYRLLGGVKE